MHTKTYDMNTEQKPYQYKHPRAALTTDCVVFNYSHKEGLRVLLIKRGKDSEAFAERWALPGGFLHVEGGDNDLNVDKSLEECAMRELREETCIQGDIKLYQFGTFGNINRDPRSRTVTVGYLALTNNCTVEGNTDAEEAKWFNLDQLPALAFDHDMIIAEARKQLRRLVYFEPVVYDLLPESFKIPQLIKLYEAILQSSFDSRNFRKKIVNSQIVKQVSENERDPEKIIRHSGLVFSFDPVRYRKLKDEGFIEF